MTTPIAIEHGPTPHGDHLVKVDGVLLGEPHGKAGGALEAAKTEQVRLQALPDNRGVLVTVTRRYFQVTQSKGAKLPPKKPKPIDELTVAEVSELSIPKLEEAIDTAAYDDNMDELLALERAKGQPRMGAIQLLEAEIAALKDDAEVAAAYAAWRETHAAELEILKTPADALILDIANGDHDERLDALIAVEVDEVYPLATIEGEVREPRQAVLDALSDRSVAKAQAEADAEAEAAAAAAKAQEDADAAASKAAQEKAEAEAAEAAAAKAQAEADTAAEAAAKTTADAAEAGEDTDAANADTAGTDTGDGEAS